MSTTRKKYFIRLIFRGIIVFVCVLEYILKREDFGVIYGFNFLRERSRLDILWGIWIAEMLWQLYPAKKYMSLGSQKQFRRRFKPIVEKVNIKALKDHIVRTSRLAYWIFLLWALMIGFLAFLKIRGLIGGAEIFLVTVFFYLCDLICVLIWCPFRLFLGNRCCTTCRIFNWDHLMMFSPLILVPGVYTYSLVFLALIDFAVWEFAVLLHPERFWDGSNAALSCSECTDKLCTQYCQGLFAGKIRG